MRTYIDEHGRMVTRVWGAMTQPLELVTLVERPITAADRAASEEDDMPGQEPASKGADVLTKIRELLQLEPDATIGDMVDALVKLGSGGDVEMPDGAIARLHEITPREARMCREMRVDPAAYAAKKRAIRATAGR